MSYLNIQKGKFFIVYCFMKIFVSSSRFLPPAKNLAKKTYEVEILFLPIMSPPQISESLEIHDWKEDMMGTKVISADFVFALPSSTDLLNLTGHWTALEKPE